MQTAAAQDALGLMYLLICSYSSPLLDLFLNYKEQDSSVMYLNWMLTAAGENASSLFINQKKKKKRLYYSFLACRWAFNPNALGEIYNLLF